MIMSSMREKTKVVLFVVLLAFVGFIFFDWGMNAGSSASAREGVVGKVNGEDITADAYRRMRAQMAQSFEQRTGRAPEIQDNDALDEETWVALVRETLVQQQIEKYGVTISDAEILELLRTNPPDEIRAQFTNEQGEFDVAAYQSALSNPALAAQWASVENYLRAMLPADKIQNYVGLNARVTTAEAHDRFVARNEKAKVRYAASLTATAAPESELDDAALKAYYDAHVADWAVGPRAVLEYVRIPKMPSAADSGAVRSDLEALRADIVTGGQDFAEVARTWSDDTSAERGGDLGTFGRGDMVPEFEQVAFALPVGQVSDVFQTPFGFHIVKVEERKTEGGKEIVGARHILLRVEASNETLREASDRLDDFLVAVHEDGADWAKAAAASGLTVERTPPFEAGSPIPDLGLSRAAERFAFSASPGESTREPVEDELAFWAFRLVERRPAGTAPFEDVKDRVTAAATEAKRREAARDRIESAVAAAGGSVDAIAKAMGAAVDTTAEFTRESFIPGVGRRDAFAATAFSLEVGATSGIVETDRGFFVIQVLGRIAADESQFAQQQPEIRRQLLMEKRQALVTAWIEQLVRDAKIVDFRSGKGVEWTPDAAMFTYL